MEFRRQRRVGHYINSGLDLTLTLLPEQGHRTTDDGANIHGQFPILSADQQKVLGAMTSDQIAKFKQFGDRVSRDSSFINAIGTDSREAKVISSRLATATSRSERAEATFSQRTAFVERLSTAREHGETISIDIAQDPHNLEMFMRYAQQYGGDSAAAFALFDAELARQGLRPNRAFSDGTALPTSFTLPILSLRRHTCVTSLSTCTLMTGPSFNRHSALSALAASSDSRYSTALLSIKC